MPIMNGGGGGIGMDCRLPKGGGGGAFTWNVCIGMGRLFVALVALLLGR